MKKVHISRDQLEHSFFVDALSTAQVCENIEQVSQM